MGYVSARDMVGSTDFATAFGWHLSSNHYPPYPPKFIEAMTPVAREAVELVEAHASRVVIDLPDGIEFHGRTWAYAFEIVDSLHLEAFIENESDEEDEDA